MAFLPPKELLRWHRRSRHRRALPRGRPGRQRWSRHCAARASSCRKASSATARSSIRDGARRGAQELCRRRPDCRSNVRLGVANQQIVVRVVELPRIEDEKQRDAAVRFQAAEAIAMPLDEAVLDHQVAGIHRGGRRHPAHAGRARGRAPLDDRGSCSRPSSTPGLKPRASTSTPSRSCAPSRPQRRRARTRPHASTATSAA